MKFVRILQQGRLLLIESIWTGLEDHGTSNKHRLKPSVKAKRKRKKGVDERTEGRRENPRERKRRGNVSFSRWPASSALSPSTPPSPLGSQVARLGTDGPPSRLHAGPAGPSKHKAAVVGDHQPDVVQRKDGQGSVWRPGIHTHLPHNAQGEQRTAWQARRGFFKAIVFKKNDTSVHPWGILHDWGVFM